MAPLHDLRVRLLSLTPRDGRSLAEHPAPALATRERLLGAALAVLVAVASILSAGPQQSAAGGTGNTTADTTGPRIVIDALSRDISDAVLATPSVAQAGGASIAVLEGGRYAPAPGTDPVDPAGIDGTAGSFDATVELGRQQPAQEPVQLAVPGPFLADGTLLKPLAVDTTVVDGRAILKRYTVRTGDTLASVGKRFNLTARTLWSTNLQLKSPTTLRVGQTLLIPPANGAVHVVADGETMESIAKDMGVPVARIVAVNKLDDPTVYIGQTLMIPGGTPRAMPKPAPTPSASSGQRSSSTVRSRPPVQYAGGRMTWPVPGGFISQYFHYGHWAIDIAGTYGIPVVAAAPGVVLFAGWKNNGGGYQVWISHGSGLYTTYNHLSAVTVGAGQQVAAGHQVGRLGMSGWATGPHCHFEVWVGGVRDSGYRVNPLNYY